MKVLVLNCGSSSLKFQLIETSPERIDSETEEVLAEGLVEKIGTADSGTHYKNHRGDSVKETAQILEHSTADAFSAVDVAANGTHHLAVAGDWSQYVIVERAGMSVELIPHLFATGANRPSGQRGFYAYWRNGADSVNDAAFRVLTLTTTA